MRPSLRRFPRAAWWASSASALSQGAWRALRSSGTSGTGVAAQPGHFLIVPGLLRSEGEKVVLVRPRRGPYAVCAYRDNVLASAGSDAGGLVVSSLQGMGLLWP
jgi:hypothetical protein